MQTKIKSLIATIDSLKRQLLAEIEKSDVTTEVDHLEINCMFNDSDTIAEKIKTFLDEHSLPRLLWEQQVQYNKSKKMQPTISGVCILKVILI